MINPRSRFLAQSFVFLLALAAAAVRAEDYSITTFAGVGLSEGSTDGTQGTSPNPLFRSPYGVAIDSAKNIYVADTVNYTIRKITPARVVTTFAGTAGALGVADGAGSAARFNFPTGVAVDSGGNVYVADFGSNTIRKITPGGVVSTFAGAALQIGSTNGNGSAARFFHPAGVAVDSAGNVYVADSDNHLIRKITAAGDVTTLAGGAQTPGYADGTGTGARFNIPWGIAVDGAGNVYVSDRENHVIRRITPAGVVSTLAGAGGVSGAFDGPASSARFNLPRGVAVDAGGNVYVADSGNTTIRFIAGGTVTTLAGQAGRQGTTDSVGASALFFDPFGIAVDGNVIYVADSSNNTVRRGLPASAAPLPTISINPLDQEVATGQSVTLRVVAAGSGLTYQWLRNGSPIGGATNTTFTITSAQESNSGSYSVRVSNSGGAIDSVTGNLTVTPPGTGPIQITSRPLSQQVDTGAPATFSVAASGSNLRYQWLKNGSTISGATNPSYTIASAQSGDAATYTVRIIAGEVSETATAKLFVGGASGPGFNITQQPNGRTVAPGEPVTFFVAISPSLSVSYQWFKNDVAIGGATTATYSIASAQTGDTGTYRVRITSAGGSVDSDTAVLSVSAPPPPATFSRLANLSILTSIASAGDNFTLGYVVNGASASEPKPILIRAAGPALTQFGVGGVLGDPKLELYVGDTKSNENDNWGGTSALSTAFAAVGAFAYLSPNSADAAVLANIVTRENTIKILATGNGTGAVIAELYDSNPVASMTAASPRLVNVSVRKPIGAKLTAGFVIDGNTSKKVLIRAVGPSLGTLFGVQGVVADPQLTLFSSAPAVIGTNNDWGGTAELTAAFASVGAFPLPAASRDAAILVTLPAGNYTVEVTGVGGTTGEALVEVYDVP